MPLEGSSPLGLGLLIEFFETLPRKNIHGGRCFDYEIFRTANKKRKRKS
jgi:hypothetical protein